MVSGTTRIAGILAVLVGFLMTSTGIGAIIGIPLMIIGFILFVPEEIKKNRKDFYKRDVNLWTNHIMRHQISLSFQRKRFRKYSSF